MFDISKPGAVRKSESWLKGGQGIMIDDVLAGVMALGRIVRVLPAVEPGGMKYLALDYGTRRVGVAVSDPDGMMAFPRRTLKREVREAFFAELLALIDEERAGRHSAGLSAAY